MSETTTVTETTPTTEAAPDVAQAPSMKEKFKLNVYGEEIEEEVDWNDKAGLTAKLQRAAAADRISESAKKQISEAKSDRAKAMQILEAFENGTLLSKHPKAREMAEKLLMEQIQDEMLDPKDKEIRELKSKNSKYEQTDKETKEAADKKVNAEKEYKIAQEFQATIIGALNKSGLPKSPKLVQRAAELMSKNLDYGLTLTVDDLVSELKGETSEINKAIIKDMDGAQLIEMFGPEIAKKIRQYDLQKLTESQGKVFQKGAKAPVEVPKPEGERHYQTTEEWQAATAARIANHR